MTACFDLHSHSLASDGALSPTDLVARAADYGVTHLALTDHDTLRGLDEARQAAQARGMPLINGIELSVRHANREFHVLGLWVDVDDPTLQARVSAHNEARINRAREIGRRLEPAAGLANRYVRARELADNDAPGRPWLAKPLEQPPVP